MLKKTVLLITVFFCLFNLNAQEENNAKLIVETGFLPLTENKENLALFLQIEPKVKISKNAFIGLRIGLTLNSHAIELEDNFEFYINEAHNNGILSFVPTIDYYLSDDHFRPYLGGGLGYHISPHPIEIFGADIGSPAEGILEGDLSKRVGLLLRGGFESRRLRLGLEYTFMPKADIEIPDSQTIGSVANSYLGVSAGFIIGIGKKSR